MRIPPYLLTSGLFLLVCAASAPAQEIEPDAEAGITFSLDSKPWQPGQRYRSGNDWLALVCQKSECRLEPAKLMVRKEKWQSHYDNEATDGQRLTFKRQTSGPGQVLAWFRLDANVPWLVPGPVATYAASTAKPKRPASEGTLELAVDLPDGTQATLVPLYDKPNGKFLLQLRVPGKRQLLDELGACSHEVTSDYLVWAGDLDRDGQPDYLINFADGEGKLYLGKQAAPNEIAGEAGVYSPPPHGGECDGSGWLK